MRSLIKDQYGKDIGYSIERGGNIEYYCLQPMGLVGIYRPAQRMYTAYGLGGNGMKSQTDIGAGECFRVYTENKR
jgi:hypothetical protein